MAFNADSTKGISSQISCFDRSSMKEEGASVDSIRTGRRLDSKYETMEAAFFTVFHEI